MGRPFRAVPEGPKAPSTETENQHLIRLASRPAESDQVLGGPAD